MTSEAQKAGARRVFGRARALAAQPASDRAGAEPQLPPRRGRFASLADDRAEEIGALSAFEILFFDLLPTKGADSERIAMDRVRSLAFAGPYLAASHFICAMVLFIHQARVGLDPLGLALIGGVTIFAFLPYVLLTRRRTRELRPHRVVQLWLAFIVAIGSLWCALMMSTAGDGAASPSSLVYGALAGAFCLTIAAFLNIPSLLLASYCVAASAFVLIVPDRSLVPLLFVFGSCLLGASIFGSRGVLFSAARKLSIEAQALKAQRLVAEFEQSGRGWFWETDAEGALTHVSTRLAAELGKDPSELNGAPFKSFMSDEYTETVDGLERTLGFHLSTRLAFSDVTVRADTDKDIWWSISGTPHFDEYGRFLGFSGIGTDLTETRRSQAEINRLARFDALTGLPNRMMMRMTLDDALRNIEKQRRGCALFLIDLDRFKNVNDTLGHPVGDALLRQVADRLRSVIGSDGQVGRLGGDEFEAVFPAIDAEGWLSSLARRLIEQVSLPYVIDGHNVSIGASVGIAIASSAGQCADALIRDADLALYAAKDDGRGTFRIFSPEMHSEAKERQALEEELRHALAHGQLKVVYQPIVHAITEEILGFEALCRWLHPTRGYVPTDRFIALAEECGLILQIGGWVLKTACADAAKWPENIRIAVNISAIQFANPEFPTSVMSAVASSGLSPERLELEVTESVFISGSEATGGTFARLKGLGVRLALDDFGTGYSSLGYLKKAPFDKIKIDQSFVRGATQPGSRNGAIIASITSLAHALGMDTTAEGVETLDELDLVRMHGCSHVQGFIYEKALSAEAASERLEAGLAAVAHGPRASRSPRQTMLRKIVLDHHGQLYNGTIRNVSSTGALIEGLWNVPAGTIFKVQLSQSLVVTATARWCQDDKMGVEFSVPLERDSSGRIAAVQERAPPPVVRPLLREAG